MTTKSEHVKAVQRCVAAAEEFVSAGLALKAFAGFSDHTPPHFQQVRNALKSYRQSATRYCENANGDND